MIFCFSGAQVQTDEGERVKTMAVDTLQYLGVSVAHHKSEGPTTCLGILVDTVAFQLGRTPPG